jgi:hypothetical protein
VALRFASASLQWRALSSSGRRPDATASCALSPRRPHPAGAGRVHLDVDRRPHRGAPASVSSVRKRRGPPPRPLAVHVLRVRGRVLRVRRPRF